MPNSSKLQSHVFSTYITLRYGMAILAMVFPLFLYAYGNLFHGLPLQDSMSAYYWAPDPGSSPVRVWFIGGLFALGAFFYLYKGFGWRENLALNLASVMAVGVAYFPMEWADKGVDADQLFTLHGFCAIAMFSCLAYVAWFCSHDTLPHLSDKDLVRKYVIYYRITSAMMLLSPITAFVLTAILKASGAYVFFIELVGIWAFSAYWILKSSELKTSHAEIDVLKSGSG